MIIGISGKKQVGKDTVCNIFRALDINRNTDYENISELIFNSKELNKSIWKKKSFAEPLKKMACILTGFPDVSFWESSAIKDSVNKTFGVTNRIILQVLGQSLRDNLDQDVWINALFSTYTPAKHNRSDNPKKVVIEAPYWIITDVRMPNELKAIKDRGGVIIRINRNTEYQDSHISETALDNYKNFDYVIDNNGNINELIDKIIPIYNKICL